MLLCYGLTQCHIVAGGFQFLGVFGVELVESLIIGVIGYDGLCCIFLPEPFESAHWRIAPWPPFRRGIFEDKIGTHLIGLLGCERMGLFGLMDCKKFGGALILHIFQSPLQFLCRSFLNSVEVRVNEIGLGLIEAFHA